MKGMHMDKKRLARRIVIGILVTVFILCVAYYAATLIGMYNDRVYLYYDGQVYRAHRMLGSGYELPDDAVELGKAVCVPGGKRDLTEDFQTTLARTNLTVYRSPSYDDRLYVLEKDNWGGRDVWIFGLP